LRGSDSGWFDEGRGKEWHETMGMSAFGIFNRMEIGIWIEGGGVAAL